MADVMITPRRQIDWGQLGQAVAQPFQQQQATQQQLMPLLFKAQLDRLLNPEDIEYKKAQTEYIKNVKGVEKIKEIITRNAWDEYQKGNKSPQVLKVLGMWVSPMEEMMANQFGFYTPTTGGGSNVPPSLKQDNYVVGKIYPEMGNAKYLGNGQWEVGPKKPTTQTTSPKIPLPISAVSGPTAGQGFQDWLTPFLQKYMGK